MRSIDNVQSSQSLSVRWYTRAIGGQAWAFTARWALLDNSEARKVMGVIAGLRGSLNELTVKPPLLKDSAGAGGEAITVNGASQTGSSLNIGRTGAVDGVRVAGDYFTIGSDPKAYQLTADVSDVATSIQFYPPLVKSPANGATLTFTDVTFQMRAVSEYRAEVVKTNYFAIELDMIESF
jgi:hypothetical protein